MAAAMNSGALLNAMPRMESDTFVRSRAAIYPATLVSLSQRDELVEQRGQNIFDRLRQHDEPHRRALGKPELRPASACPRSMEAMPPRMISARTRCTSPFTRYFLHYFFSFLFLLTSNLNHDIPEASLRTTPEASLRTTREVSLRETSRQGLVILRLRILYLRITPYRGTSTMM